MSQLKFPKHPIPFMWRMHRHLLPMVYQELDGWRTMAEQMPNAELQQQALASIADKKFHCQGGAVYAALNRQMDASLIRLIVAFQTISDYLDNLCDRSTSLDPADFRQLHMAMLEAINPQAEQSDYYKLREEQDDGGYLAALVTVCQEVIAELPAYDVVQDHVRELVGYYCDLQVHKHIARDYREEALLSWWESHRNRAPDWRWNEFAAATGSTIGVFMLFAAASDPDTDEKTAMRLRLGYFPALCGLHIQLDYLIDQEEDRIEGDLNFCFYYESSRETAERLEWMVEEARVAALTMPGAAFHKMIVEGLLALYLSDPKVRKQEDVWRITKRIMKGSPATRLFFWLNSLWIRKGGRKS